MAKKQENPAGNPRHGDPVVIGIPPKHIDYVEDDGTVKLNRSGLDHVRALASEAVHAKQSGEADLAAGFRRDLDPYAITNTVSHSHAVYIDSVPLGTTTINDGTPAVGGETPEQTVPAEFRTKPLRAKQVLQAIGVTDKNAPQWLNRNKDTYPHDRSGDFYIMDRRRLPTGSYKSVLTSESFQEWQRLNQNSR